MSRPSKSIEAVQHRGAERAGEVRTTDAPVEAGQADRTALRIQRIQVDSQIAAESRARAVMRTVHNREWPRRPERRLLLTNGWFPLAFQAEAGVS